LSLRRQESLLRHLAQRTGEVASALKPVAGKVGAIRAAAEAFVCAEHAYREGRTATEVETLLAAALKDGVAVGPAFALRGLLALDKGKLRQALADAERATLLR